MTVVSKFDDPIEIACDECGFVFDDPEEADERDFKGVLAEMKKLNWTVRKIGDSWIHLCGDCNGKNEVSPRNLRR